MGKNVKIRNENDKTIFELKLEDNTQNEKIKPGKVFLRFLFILLAIAISVLVGYFLYKLLA